MHVLMLSVLALAGCGGAGENSAPPPDSACLDWSTSMMMGTAGSDELLDVVIDRDGNAYLAGYERGTTGRSTVEPSGNAEGAIYKLAPDGTIVFRQPIDTPATEVVEALALSPDDQTVYLAGRTNGALNGFANAGQFDSFVGWLDARSGTATLFQSGTERPEHPRRIAPATNNGLFIAGFDDVYVPTNYVEAWENPLLARFDRAGGTAWETWRLQPETDYPDRLAGLVAADDGGVFVTGGSEGGSNRGMFVARYDAGGSEVWSSQQSSIPYDMGAALLTLPNGDILLAGATYETLGARAYGGQDIVLRRLNPATGEVISTVQFGSADTDWVTDMALDAQGNIYVVGETYGVIETGRTNAGAVDAFLVKFRPDGSVALARQWGTSGVDAPTAVAVDACQRALIVGVSEGDLAGTSNGGRDGFVLAVDTRT